jgi:oligopeptide/dipeptide ABC transporter ATP-binding protein
MGVLRVRDLSVRFQTTQRSFAAVDGVSFDLERGEALALMGESGSGKTTVALSLLRLLPPGASARGRVEVLGEDLLALPEDALVRFRGRRIAMVFHDPLAALNPVLRIGTQIGECLDVHRDLRGKAARDETARLLHTVGLGAEHVRRFPHQLSGGMRQRALIAVALACGPSILVADEPTSSLDPASQAGIVALLRALRRERGIALLVATHDFGFAARLCDTVAVLYAGRVVERGRTEEILERPRHPYTEGLLRSLPPQAEAHPGAPLRPLDGSPSPAWALPGGCRFRDRCRRRQDDCARQEPPLVELDGRAVACFHPLEPR